MVRGKKAKTASLALVAICLILSLAQLAAPVPSAFPLGLVAIHAGCGLLPRLLYSFFHASLLHCLINSWCLLSVVFYYDLPLSALLTSYLIAATFPVDHISFIIYHLSFSEAPTVGLSGLCFALMAQASFRASRKLFFHTWIAGFLAFSSLVPYLCSVCGYAIATPNTPLHIYCYVVGLMVGFLNSPAPWQRK